MHREYKVLIKDSYKVARRGEQVLKLAMLAGAAIIPRPLAAIGKRRYSVLQSQTPTFIL